MHPALKTTAIIQFILILASTTAAQVWQVDQTSQLQIRAHAFADEFGRLPPSGANSGTPVALCPVPPMPDPLLPFSSYDWAQQLSYAQSLPLIVCPALTDTFDLGGGVFVLAEENDPLPFPIFVNIDGSSVVGIRGVGTRTLEVKWRSTTLPDAASSGYFGRVCTDLLSSISAQIVNADDAEEIEIRWEWDYQAFADEDNECPGSPGCLPTQFDEDPELSEGSLTLDIDGMGPGNFFNVSFSDASGVLKDRGSLMITSPPSTIPVTVDISSRASGEINSPGSMTVPQEYTDLGGGEFCGSLRLTIVPRRPILSCVPEDSNFTYSFYIARYEVTNDEFSRFLNDAEADGGATGRGSNMIFLPDGSVRASSGGLMFEPQSAAPASKIVYASFQPIGSRYSVLPLFENHPVVHVTWLGAIKYCNWLTIDEGFNPAERCYTESAVTDLEWHPQTISDFDWTIRDLNDPERQALVDNYRGYRLAMDNLSGQTGPISNQLIKYNEWYRAAAYDPSAPNVNRLGPGGENVPPDCWIFGFGRDLIDNRDANYLSSQDPYEVDDAPVGYYNSLTELADNITPTRPNANRLGLYDMSGNVWEWVQCRGLGLGIDFGDRGGSFQLGSTQSAASQRASQTQQTSNDDLGLRVVRTVSCCCNVAGDADNNGLVTISDAVYLINYIFAGGPAPNPQCQGDADGNGLISISDVVFLINYIFGGGASPSCP